MVESPKSLKDTHMKSNNKLTNALVSVEAAWICAAEVDMQQEEEERVELLARLRKQSVKGKYELASASTRLDQELLDQQLQWKKKTELRRLRQLPANERKLTVNVVETSSNNNRKKCSVYAMENLRLAMLMKDTKLRQRVKRKKVRPRIVQDMLTLERRYAEAARKLQKWWRGHLHRHFLRVYFKQVKAVLQIQRLARGFLTRQWGDTDLETLGVFECGQDPVDHTNVFCEEVLPAMQAGGCGIAYSVCLARILFEKEIGHTLAGNKSYQFTATDKTKSVAQLEYGYYTKHEQIHDMESIYLDMQTQRMRVSPRAIEHGWVEEMEAKMKQQRALITKLKLETVFELGLEFKRKEKELVEFQQRINAIEEKRRRFEIWRNEEYLDNWERECRFRYQAKIIQKRQQVAETRRRWQIQLYRTNGKSDHRWRGSHWSPDVLEAAKEKEVFCIGSTDILALVHDKWQLRMHEIEASEQVRDDIEMERDTREHIDDLADQVALTAATAQIEQTKVLFNPVFQDVDLSFDRIQMLQREHDRRLVATRQTRKTRESDHVTTVGEVQSTECLVRRAEDPIHALDRQQRKRQLVLVAKVPWHLVDQLEVERRNLESEKATFKLWGKAYSRE
ncbi:hypothetical protein PC113_g18082 [Phytophthora cactorum]|uniref:IQ motif, EF-hand binding site n=2 Tax=Phytophthora cactorum TaxID=29920 RepID=A0A8T0YRL7_9STRA|nr:hypothetical protein PC113_g18082 [Phytophthora cactorum]KAG3095609.1 hypothetical protein PC122_g5236 [Phytophthora cactorum]KAG3136926.1 hypothetical protein C6341_g21197 [Phytophthora cactorum]